MLRHNYNTSVESHDLQPHMLRQQTSQVGILTEPRDYGFQQRLRGNLHLVSPPSKIIVDILQEVQGDVHGTHVVGHGGSLAGRFYSSAPPLLVVVRTAFAASGRIPPVQHLTTIRATRLFRFAVTSFSVRLFAVAVSPAQSFGSRHDGQPRVEREAGGNRGVRDIDSSGPRPCHRPVTQCGGQHGCSTARVLPRDRRHDGFVRAAQYLHVAQPSLSQAIARLERDLGVTLFHRIGRGVVLSNAGSELIEPARQVLRDLRTARTTMDSMKGLQRGTVELVTMPSPGIEPLGTLIQRFTCHHPGTTVEVGAAFTPEEVVDDVRLGRCELVWRDHLGRCGSRGSRYSSWSSNRSS